MLVDEFIFGNASLKTVIDDYVHAQAVLQTVNNPSGPFLPEGVGLGEPKFLVDGTRFNGAWGRPQRDGPALRATALMTYSNWLIRDGQHVRISAGQYFDIDFWDKPSPVPRVLSRENMR